VRFSAAEQDSPKVKLISLQRPPEGALTRLRRSGFCPATPQTVRPRRLDALIDRNTVLVSPARCRVDDTTHLNAASYGISNSVFSVDFREVWHVRRRDEMQPASAELCAYAGVPGDSKITLGKPMVMRQF
jgi:hypothetical protein